MPERSSGDDAQIKMMLDDMGRAVITRFVAEHPELSRMEAEIPAPLKWAGGIIAALFTAGVGGLAFWLVTSVSDMQVTLARMDERMASGVVKDSRYEPLERRVTRLETYHSEGTK